MAKMWAGRTDGATDRLADDFNSSIGFDSRMFRQDIRGSMAHAAMLSATGIIGAEEADTLIAGLEGILKDLERGTLSFDPACEDIHMFVEEVLTARVGDVGKKLHTARSRNDQVALDLRMYLMEEIDAISALLKQLIATVTDKAECYEATIMPGYTHLQRAQPVTFGHHLMAYAMMFRRDTERLADCRKRTAVCPIGSCALAGTTYPTDRRAEAAALGFSSVCENSMDGVSDRDFCAELLGALSILMMHLSRFSEEIILWSSWEFRFVELSDAFTTGSSIMPQKKNPWTLEHIKGKSANIEGLCVGAWAVMKNTPYTHNNESSGEGPTFLWNAFDEMKACIELLNITFRGIKLNKELMVETASNNFCTMAELANTLVRADHISFRTAHDIVAHVVDFMLTHGKKASEIDVDVIAPIAKQLFNIETKVTNEEIQLGLDPVKNANSKDSLGGSAPEEVLRQLDELMARLEENISVVTQRRAQLEGAKQKTEAKIQALLA